MKHAARFGNGAYLAEDLEKAEPRVSRDKSDFASLLRASKRRTRSKSSASYMGVFENLGLMAPVFFAVR